MKKKLCVVAMMAGLMLWGCGQDEKVETTAPETMTSAEQTMDTMEQETAAVAEQMAQPAEAEEKMEQAAMAEQETMPAAAAKVQEKAAVVAEKSEKTTTESKAAADKLTTTVESVVLDNSYGKIVLPHKKHAEAHGCAACHGTQKPGPFELGKDAGHALCQGCHKEKQAGPTSCTQCHQKKAKAIEGC